MARNIMSVFNQRPRVDELFEVSPMPQVSAIESRVTSEIQDVTPRSAIKLGKTLVFRGELSVGEDVLLLGRVEGSFAHSESLTVGVGGIIIGDVTGRVLTVKGTIEGDIEATESVVIMPGSVVTGDIVAPRINIIEGAMFNGSVKMVSATAEASKHGSSKLTTVDGGLTEEAVDQLLNLLNERKKS